MWLLFFPRGQSCVSTLVSLPLDPEGMDLIYTYVFLGVRMKSHSKLFTFSDYLATHHRHGRKQVADETQALDEKYMWSLHEC